MCKEKKRLDLNGMRRIRSYSIFGTWTLKWGPKYGPNCKGVQFHMLPLSPTLAEAWTYANTHGKVDEREMKKRRNEEYKTSLILRDQAPNLRILPHSNICKGTQNKTKSKREIKAKDTKQKAKDQKKDLKSNSQRDFDIKMSQTLISFLKNSISRT